MRSRKRPSDFLFTDLDVRPASGFDKDPTEEETIKALVDLGEAIRSVLVRLEGEGRLAADGTILPPRQKYEGD